MKILHQVILHLVRKYMNVSKYLKTSDKVPANQLK